MTARSAFDRSRVSDGGQTDVVQVKRRIGYVPLPRKKDQAQAISVEEHSLITPRGGSLSFNEWFLMFPYRWILLERI
jgi:hypothetical protein